MLLTSLTLVILSLVSPVDEELPVPTSKLIYKEWAKSNSEARVASEKVPKSKRLSVYQARSENVVARVKKNHKITSSKLIDIITSGVFGDWPTDSPIDSIRAEEFYNSLADKASVGTKHRVMFFNKYLAKPGDSAFVVQMDTESKLSTVNGAKTLGDLKLIKALSAARQNVAELQRSSCVALPVNTKIEVVIVGKLYTGDPFNQFGQGEVSIYAKIKHVDKYLYIDADHLAKKPRSFEE